MYSASPSADGSDIRVLHVDDDQALLETVQLCFEHAHEEISVTTVTEASEALEQLEYEQFDCVVSDYEMPEMDGLELLGEVRSHSDVPFILFTGKRGDDVATSAFATDVTDYVQKGCCSSFYDELADRIRQLVSTYRTTGR